jgi:hypothetical protein
VEVADINVIHRTLRGVFFRKVEKEKSKKAEKENYNRNCNLEDTLLNTPKTNPEKTCGDHRPSR